MRTRVAVLVGKPPADFTLPPLPLTTPPPPIPVGIPSELLERRPDIAAAERRVASANAEVGLAKTAYYPLVNIMGTGGFESGSITTLLQGPSAMWSIGGSLVQTLFDGAAGTHSTTRPGPPTTPKLRRIVRRY